MKKSDPISCQHVVLKPHGEHQIVSDALKKHSEDIFEFSTSRKNSENDVENRSYYNVLVHQSMNPVSNHREVKNSRYYGLPTDFFGSCLISKIILKNFPIENTYYLQANGQNLATARPLNGKLTIDITNPKKSNSLSMMIAHTRCNHEPDINNRSDFLNISLIDSIGILSTRPLKSDYTMEFQGYFYRKGEWCKEPVQYTVYPGDTKLLFEGAVREFTVRSKPNQTFLIRMLDAYYGPFRSRIGQITFYFDGFPEILHGCQNKYLSIDKNERTLNFSRIQSPSLIDLDYHKDQENDLPAISYLRYETYFMDTCEPVFFS